MKHTIHIKTLTPIHIGSGTELNNNIDFIIHNQHIHIIDYNKLSAHINREQISSLHTYFEQKKSIKDILPQNFDWNQISKRSIKLNTNVKEKTNFFEFIHDARFRPYIPGSSIKGPINTAIYLIQLEDQKPISLDKIKKEKNFDIIFDGTNYDDIKLDHRPGRLAAKKYGIKSPLMETKLTKKEIRALSKKFGLETFNKPSMACLSSRIPYGEKIDIKNIKVAEKTEKVIKTFWDKFFRARCHKNILRIEVEKNKILEFVKMVNIDLLLKKLHKIGHKFIVLDLDGYIPAGIREIKYKSYK
jgi:CRISPR/Cas system CSM-associated protein Csm3 (group 7 of RAMP superfamily)